MNMTKGCEMPPPGYKEGNFPLVSLDIFEVSQNICMDGSLCKHMQALFLIHGQAEVTWAEQRSIPVVAKPTENDGFYMAVCFENYSAIHLYKFKFLSGPL